MGVAAGVLSGVGSVLSGGSGIASTLMTNSANKDIAQMNNEFNEKMLDKQINYNKEMYQQQLGDTWQFYNDSKQNQWDMWNATNEYNSASAQRQRLEAAGLNPQLLMSGNNVGTATATGGTSASSPSAQGINPPTATPYSADYSGIAQGVGAAIDAYNQIANSAADRKVKEAQANNLRIEGKYMARQILVDMYSKYTNAKNDTERTAIAKFLSSFEADLKASQTALNNENIALVRNQARIAATQDVIMNTRLQFLPMQLKYELIDKKADISVKIATERLTRKQIEHECEKISETIARASIADTQAKFDQETFNDRKQTIYWSLINTYYEGDSYGLTKGIGKVIEGVKSVFD